MPLTTISNKFGMFGLALFLAIIVLTLDVALPLGVAGGVPYVAVILLGLWFPDRRQIVLITIVAISLTIFGYYLSPEGGVFFVVMANRGLAIFAILVTGFLLYIGKTGSGAQSSAFSEMEDDQDAGTWNPVKIVGSWSIVVSLLTFLSIFGIIFFVNKETNESMEWVVHTQQVHGDLSNTLSLLQDLETGQRGYLLTGDKTYLEPFEVAVTRLDQRLSDLKELTSDNPTQQNNIKSISPLIESKIAELNETIMLRQRDGFTAALAVVRTGVGKQDMDKIRVILQAMKDEETSLLFERERRFEILQFYSSIAYMFAIFLFVCVSIVVVIRLRNFIAFRRKSETHLLEAQQLAEAANKSKSEFLASMSHEIRTPMAGVIGLTDLVLDTDLSPTQLDWITSIKSSGQNLLKILNEILDQSKLEAGKLDISPVNFHLASTINDTVQLFGPKIDEKNLELDVEIDKNLPLNVYADQLRIGQILSNFMSNALKFTDTGRISIGAEQKPLDDGRFMLLVRVTDSGIGLSDEAQENLFSAFSQGDSSTSRKYGGTGLGLSISKQLVELMGGEIGADSTDGQGSTFWFTVPYHAATGEVVAPDNRRSLDRWLTSRSLKVLLADDNAVNQQMISAILSKIGHDVVVVDNGARAVDAVKKQDFDLVLMDIRMPIMDGLEATSLIRSMGRDKSGLPIIALTADIAAGNIKEYLAVGINDVCGKPIDLPVVLKSINKQLREEIHTSIPSAPIAKPIKTDDGPEEELSGDTSFAAVLERVSAVADQITDSEKEADEPPMMLAALGEDKFSELLALYETGLAEQSDALLQEMQAFADKPADTNRRAKVKELTHSLKGGGGSLGYHLITTIATKADGLLYDKETLDDLDMIFLKNHAKALSLVSSKKLAGNGGKAGRILLQGLEDDLLA